MLYRLISSSAAALVTGACLMIPCSPARAASPALIITNLPAYGSAGNLGGVVSNANFTTHCVVVFIYVAGDWYSKPSCAGQLTPIQPDGSWSANITTGGSDKSATEIAAFLVPTNYNQPCVDGTPGLTIPAQAEAVVYANRVDPGTRRFTFSNYGWSVKTSAGSLSGPGPNYFSDSTNNVWVDAQGRLHLKITYTSNEWQCVEIISDRSFGYGQYRFTVQADVNGLDPNVVLGMFTWSNDSAYNDREIDIELSRWDYANGANNVEDYAISPYGTGQVIYFPLPVGVTNSTHSFIWQTNQVAFQSLNGQFDPAPASANILRSWSSATGIPPAGGEQIHINLWLDHGNPPVNNQPTEVTLSDFEFVPLGPPPPAQLTGLVQLSGGGVQLNVRGQSDQHYQIFSSSNFLDWLGIGTILATNNYVTFSSVPVAFTFTDTNPASLPPRFYRTVTEP